MITIENLTPKNLYSHSKAADLAAHLNSDADAGDSYRVDQFGDNYSAVMYVCEGEDVGYL